MRHLIEKEIRLHLGSLRFLILAAAAAAGIWLCIYDGYATYADRLEDYHSALRLTDRRLEEIREDGRNTDVSREGMMLHKPPVVLSIVSRSLDPVLGRSARTGWSQLGTRMTSSPSAVDPPGGAFLPLDLGFLCEIVLTLFAILLTYDAVCGEKEDGTLRLLSSYPLSRARLLTAKGAGAFAAIAVVFWLPYLLGLSVIFAMPDVLVSTKELIRFGLSGVSITVALGLFVSLGLLGSALCQRSATSFVLLLSYWALSVIVLPKVSFIVADLLRPAPSVRELRAGREEIHKRTVAERSKETRIWFEAFEAKHGEAWQDSAQLREQGSFFNKEAGTRQGELADEGYKRLNEAYENAYEARADLARALACGSPAFLLRNTLSTLCGTGLVRLKRFEDRYNAFVDHEFHPWIGADVWDMVFSRAWPEKYGVYEWDASDMPLFTYTESWPDEEITGALLYVGLLAGWGLAFFAAAFVALLRYDPR